MEGRIIAVEQVFFAEHGQGYKEHAFVRVSEPAFRILNRVNMLTNSEK